MTKIDKMAQLRAAHRQAIEEGKVEVISRRRGEGILDPRDQFRELREYLPEHLPAIFNAYVDDAIASWGGDPGAYACAFIAMHVGVLHSSVKMNTNPLKPNNWRNPNDFSLTLGKSGANKSGMFKDLTRHQESWQKAMTRAAAKVASTRRQHPPMCFLQNASIEGMMLQVADNQGDRLLLGSEEAMSFYDGAGMHHKDNAVNAMSNAVCTVYDGALFSKRLVNKVITIPEALATLIMATTIDKITGWKSFAPMVDAGLMARHTVGVLVHPREADQTKLIPKAEEAMGDMLLKMRGMRDIRFVLAPDAREPWLGFRKAKEAANNELEANGAKPGLVAWARKYDMRIMSMAVVLQTYDYIAGGMMEHTEVQVPATEADAGKTDDGMKPMRTVVISRDNLSRAIDFVEGYLYDVQEHFYAVADGVTEFGSELLNFLAYRITKDEPDNPECRVIGRLDLTSKGPAVCRGAVTPALKETHNRWIQALLDHGYVEVYDHPRARRESKHRRDCEERWFKVRDEVFEYFNTEEDRSWLRAHFEGSRVVGERGVSARKPLGL